MYDLIITNGTIVDGTGAQPRHRRRRGEGRRDRRGVGSRPLDGDARRDHRRHRPARHARLRRHPHALRRPGHVGPAARAVVRPRRHHRRRRQLRRRVRAGAPGRREVAHRPDGGRRGHPRHRARRGHRLGLGERSPSTSTRSSGVASSGSTSACRCRTARCARTSMGERGAAQRAGQRPTRSRRWRRSCRRRSRPARSASRPRARSATAPWTAAGAGHVRGRGRAVRARAGHGALAGARCSSSRRMGAAGEDLLAPKQEMGWMCRLSDDLDLPVSFTLLQVDAAPDLWRELMDESLARDRRRRAGGPAGRGAPVRHAARASRPVTRSAGRPTYRALAARLLARRARSPSWRKPAVQAQILAEDDVAPDPTVLFDGMFLLVQALARPPLRARRPARSTSPPPTAPSRRWPPQRASTRSTMLYDVMLEHDAHAPADAAVLQLRRAQPRRHPRDAAPSRRCVRPVRRRRALRPDLRRVDPHVHAHALGARPHPRRARCRSSTW